jgi:hypothetical protein
MDRLRNAAQRMPVRVPETGLKAQGRAAIDKLTEINPAISGRASRYRHGPNDALIRAKAEPVQGAKLITERISAITVVSKEHFQQGKRDAEVKADKRKPIKAKEKHDDARIVARDPEDGKLSQEGFVKPYRPFIIMIYLSILSTAKHSLFNHSFILINYLEFY